MNPRKRKTIAGINNQLQAIDGQLNHYAIEEVNAVHNMPYAIRVTKKGLTNIDNAIKIRTARGKLTEAIDILKTL